MPAKRTKKWSSLQLAKAIARLADEKLAERIVLLDVGQAIQVADYFVIAEGKNRRHLHSIAESIAADLKKEGIYRIGGTPMVDENWVLLDFGPVVLHVFSPKGRAYYDLENLWGDCKRLRWQAPVRKAKAPAADETPAPPSG
jgi:ribosome-associated protein